MPMASTSQDKVCPAAFRSEGIRFSTDSAIATAAAENALGRFSMQAAKTPTQTAVFYNGVPLSYRDLDVKSNQLAHWLRATGVQANTLVALCTTHSPNFVIGALGIWKAGGGYLPLDPNLPAERISFLLNDAAAPILLTEQAFANEIFERDRYVMALDRESNRLSALPQTPPEQIESNRTDDLAYAIYTSGSTGMPKGVEITHGNLINLIEWHQRAFFVTSADRATQLASLSFDAAVWEIWPYLTMGASVHFVPGAVRTSPESLRDWLVENKITIGFVPTLLAESLIALEWPAKTSLRTMLTGADVLHRYPSPALPFELVNNYGPTECTVVATSGAVPADPDSSSAPFIGRPISNVQVYLLDADMKPVLPGTPGEIFIGGAGVARGYRNRPELTSERFISDPLKRGAKDRLYRTGDSACMMPDGQLAFLGRTDEQIKLSGYRVEPNEIVHALVQCAGVQAAHVIAREDAAGNKNLVAYIVAEPGAAVTSSQLRTELQRQLPAYMLPAEFVLLAELPLTASGKVDRALLPAPSAENALSDTAFVAFRNAVEERMAAIVSGLLGMSRVSVEDNFFMLGGHSLLGTQLIGRVRDAFRVELSLRSVFDAPTIAQLSAEVEKLLIAQIESLSEAEVQLLLQAQEDEQMKAEKNALQP